MTTPLSSCPPASTPIGVGIDTARYAHHVTFLRADLDPAAPPRYFSEDRQGYDQLHDAFRRLHQRCPDAHFHVRLDAAGQYATNLEHFLRQLPFPMTLSVGEPARNASYRETFFPKRKADPVDSLAAARFALREQPQPAGAVPPAIYQLREVVGRLESQVRQTTRLINQLHNLLARVFPELATLAPDLSAWWLLHLLDKYPTPRHIARAHEASLTAIAYLGADKARSLQAAARASVGSLQGETAAALVRTLVEQLRRSRSAVDDLEALMVNAYRALPVDNHLTSIKGFGAATAAVLTAKAVAIDRFATPQALVGYFGIFPEESSSGVTADGQAKPSRRQRMSAQGNDLMRKYLWNAAKAAMRFNPAVRALYRRLQARGRRGDVALGHCMRKLLHLAFAVWKTGRPFDPEHYPWEGPAAAGEEAAGHRRDGCPVEEVVTAAPATVAAPEAAGKEETPAGAAAIDFAWVRGQVSMEQVLSHLGYGEALQGSGPQRRGPCPVHGSPADGSRSFSVHLGRGVFQCFHAGCACRGNVLDLWAAVRKLPLREAAEDLVATFGVERCRPTEQRRGTR